MTPDCETCGGAGVVPGSYEFATNSWDDRECPECHGWGGPVCSVCRCPVLDDRRFCDGCAVTADQVMSDREAS